jgi:hypothetical protein
MARALSAHVDMIGSGTVNPLRVEGNNVGVLEALVVWKGGQP